MDLLKKLCTDLKLDFSDLEKTEEGAYQININELLSIAVKFLEPGVYLHATIASCPQNKREELFTLLMKANYLCQGTFGGALGLSRDEKSLTLSLTFPYEMNYRTFKATVEDFANIIDYWRTEVA